MPSIHSFAAWLSPGRAFFGSVLLAVLTQPFLHRSGR